MTQLSDAAVLRLVREGLVPSEAASIEADLWPRVRERIQDGAPPPAPWEWALTAVVVLACLLQPGVFSVLLFHF